MEIIELIKKIKEEGYKAKIFDIRSKEEYTKNHIQGAVWIERLDLIEEPDKHLDKELDNYVTSFDGFSSDFIALTLRNQGYKIENIEKGMGPFIEELELKKNPPKPKIEKDDYVIDKTKENVKSKKKKDKTKKEDNKK